MMKKICAVILSLTIALALVGCGGCKHEWTEASCDGPKTCSLCGETEGEALVHKWTEASCDNPKSCTLCGKTEGEALGHQWLDATTEAPKTCSACNATEGERIITDPRFTTAACQPLFGQWDNDMNAYMETMGYEGMDVTEVFIFNNDGTYSNNMVYDEEAMKEAMVRKSTEDCYKPFLNMGFTREEVDQQAKKLFGYDSVEAYVRASTETIVEQTMSIYENMNKSGVYYVDGNTLYVGESWEEEMLTRSFVLDGDILTISYAGFAKFKYLRAGSDAKVENEVDGSVMDMLQNSTFIMDFGTGVQEFSAGNILGDIELGGQDDTKTQLDALLKQYGY